MGTWATTNLRPRPPVCCSGEPSAAHDPDNLSNHHQGENVSTQTFPMTGLTCGHCVGAITSEVKALPGVSDVQVALVSGGTSTLTVIADNTLTEAQVASALDEAGNYQLAAS
jgi:copper chaperone